MYTIILHGQFFTLPNPRTFVVAFTYSVQSFLEVLNALVTMQNAYLESKNLKNLFQRHTKLRDMIKVKDNIIVAVSFRVHSTDLIAVGLMALFLAHTSSSKQERSSLWWSRKRRLSLYMYKAYNKT